jgi:hypothetical protein
MRAMAIVRICQYFSQMYLRHEFADAEAVETPKTDRIKKKDE